MCLTALAGFLGAATAAVAQTESTNAAMATAPKPKSKAIVGVVASVDNDGKTLTLKDHDKPIHITSKTKITKNDQPAMLSDIMAGDDVSVRAKDDASGNPTATSVRIGKVKAKKKSKPAATPAAAPDNTPAMAPANPPAPAK
jgi:Cu/Ag efflux protein CusF